MVKFIFLKKLMFRKFEDVNLLRSIVVVAVCDADCDVVVVITVVYLPLN